MPRSALMPAVLVVVILAVCAPRATADPLEDLKQAWLDAVAREDAAKRDEAGAKAKLDALEKLQAQREAAFQSALDSFESANAQFQKGKKQLDEFKRQCDRFNSQNCDSIRNIFERLACKANQGVGSPACLAIDAAKAALSGVQALVNQAGKALEQAKQLYDQANEQYDIEKRIWDSLHAAVFTAHDTAAELHDKYLNAEAELTDDEGPLASTCPSLLAMWANAAQYRSLGEDEVLSLTDWNVDETARFFDKLKESGYTSVDQYGLYLAKTKVFTATDTDSAELFFNGDHDHCILAFRGAGANIIDTASSITNAFGVTSPTYYGVTGVSRAVVTELDPLLKQMMAKGAFKRMKSQCGRLTLTGYSLGGSLAGLLGHILNRKDDPLKAGLTVDYLYTFGSTPISKRTLGNDKRDDKCFLGAQFYSVNSDGKADWALNLFGGGGFKDVNMLSVGLFKDGKTEHVPCGKDVPREVMGQVNTPHALQAIHWWEVYTQRVAGENVCTNKCSETTCGEHGLCENEPSVNQLLGFTCTCDEGWTGDRCQLQVDKCRTGELKCLNGGKCRDSTCTCSVGFEGTTCEINTDDCLDNTQCQNDGVCVDGVNSFACLCQEGFYGDLCEATKDICFTAPCQNDGKCHDMGDGENYRCECTEGWTGDNCEDPKSTTTTTPTTTTSTTRVSCKDVANPCEVVCADGVCWTHTMTTSESTTSTTSTTTEKPRTTSTTVEAVSCDGRPNCKVICEGEGRDKECWTATVAPQSSSTATMETSTATTTAATTATSTATATNIDTSTATGTGTNMDSTTAPTTVVEVAGCSGDKNCATCDKSDSDCLVCKGSQYLYRGKCVAGCPRPDTVPDGKAKTGRECVEKSTLKCYKARTDRFDDVCLQKLATSTYRAAKDSGSPDTAAAALANSAISLQVRDSGAADDMVIEAIRTYKESKFACYTRKSDSFSEPCLQREALGVLLDAQRAGTGKNQAINDAVLQISAQVGRPTANKLVNDLECVDIDCKACGAEGKCGTCTNSKSLHEGSCVDVCPDTLTVKGEEVDGRICVPTASASETGDTTESPTGPKAASSSRYVVIGVCAAVVVLVIIVAVVVLHKRAASATPASQEAPAFTNPLYSVNVNNQPATVSFDGGAETNPMYSDPAVVASQPDDNLNTGYMSVSALPAAGDVANNTYFDVKGMGEEDA